MFLFGDFFYESIRLPCQKCIINNFLEQHFSKRFLYSNQFSIIYQTNNLNIRFQFLLHILHKKMSWFGRGLAFFNKTNNLFLYKNNLKIVKELFLYHDTYLNQAKSFDKLWSEHARRSVISTLLQVSDQWYWSNYWYREVVQDQWLRALLQWWVINDDYTITGEGSVIVAIL